MTILSEGILRLKAEGKSYNEIKAELGCSKGTISYHLGAGQKEKSLDRQQGRRTRLMAYVQKLKNDTPCADCSESYPYWMMDFDHLRDKEFSLSCFWRVTVDPVRVRAEIDKCEIVCANCHRTRTHYRSSEKMSLVTQDLCDKWDL